MARLSKSKSTNLHKKRKKSDDEDNDDDDDEQQNNRKIDNEDEEEENKNNNKKLERVQNQQQQQQHQSLVANLTLAESSKRCHICMFGVEDNIDGQSILNPIRRCAKCNKDTHTKSCSFYDRNDHLVCTSCRQTKSLSRFYADLGTGNEKYNQKRVRNTTNNMVFSDGEESKSSKDADYNPDEDDDHHVENPIQFNKRNQPESESNIIYPIFPAMGPKKRRKREFHVDPFRDMFIHLNGDLSNSSTFSHKEARYVAYKNCLMELEKSFKEIDERYSSNPEAGPISDVIIGAYESMTLEDARGSFDSKWRRHAAVLNSISIDTLPTVLVNRRLASSNIATVLQAIKSSIVAKSHAICSGKIDVEILTPPTIILHPENCTNYQTALKNIYFQFTRLSSIPELEDYNQHHSSTGSDVELGDGPDNPHVIQDDGDNMINSDTEQQQKQKNHDDEEGATYNPGNSKKNFRVDVDTSRISEELTQWYKQKYYVPLLNMIVESNRRDNPKVDLSGVRFKRITPIVALESFESWNPSVVENIIIFLKSLQRSIPFVLVLSLSTNSESINTLSKESLSCVSLKCFELKSQIHAFEHFVREVFIKFNSIVEIGPQVFIFLYENFINHHLSLGFLKKQLIYAIRKHYLDHPLSFLCHDDYKTLFDPNIKIPKDLDEFHAGNNDNASGEVDDNERGNVDSDNSDDIQQPSSSSTKKILIESEQEDEGSDKEWEDEGGDVSSDSQYRPIYDDSLDKFRYQYSNYESGDESDMTIASDESCPSSPIYSRYSNQSSSSTSMTSTTTTNISNTSNVHTNTTKSQKKHQQQQQPPPISEERKKQEDAMIEMCRNFKLIYSPLGKQYLLGLHCMSEAHLQIIQRSLPIKILLRRGAPEEEFQGKPLREKIMTKFITDIITYRSFRPFLIEFYYTLLKSIPFREYSLTQPITYSYLLYQISKKSDRNLLDIFLNYLKKKPIDETLEILESGMTVFLNINILSMPRLVRLLIHMNSPDKDDIIARTQIFSTNLTKVINQFKQVKVLQEEEELESKNNQKNGKKKDNNNSHDSDSESSREIKEIQMKKSKGKNKKRSESLKQLTKISKSAKALTAARNQLAHFLSRIIETYISQDLSSFPLYEIFYQNDVESIKSKLFVEHATQVQKQIEESAINLDCSCCPKNGKITPKNEDITIVYQIYKESGRYINLYDWFTTYCAMKQAKGHPPELQATFSYITDVFQILGLVKRTNRRTDHVVKTYY